MEKDQRLPFTLMLLGIAVCLLQIWLPAYYVTGDGPCHVYNSKVLHDLWNNNDVPFYSRFYTLSHDPNPNWLTTVAIAGIMYLVNGIIAEKIFLTLYVAFYVSGFYLLLRKISNKNPYWPLLIFFFVFTHALSKGFYNFSFSIAFFFWVIWSWLRFMDKWSIGNGAVFILFCGICFFTHLLPFAFAIVTCGALVLSYALAQGKKQFVKAFKGNAGFFIAFIAPFLWLTYQFTDNQGGMHIKLHPYRERLVDILSFNYLVNVKQQEAMPAHIGAMVLLLLLVTATVLRIKKGLLFHKYDGFAAGLAVVLMVYLLVPEEFLGRLILISMRTQLFIFILAACCIGYMLPAIRLHSLAGLLLFACFVIMSIYRIDCQLKAANGVADLLSGSHLIRPRSVVLPMNFSPSGKDAQGYVIADRNWLFIHTGQYLGVEKPLIVLDNYEANINYFPLLWKDATNPYHHLSREEGIEGVPPFAIIEEYKSRNNVTIDYIVSWCFDSSYLAQGHMRELMDEINTHYDIIYASPSQRTVLYERKKEHY